jgi:ribose/xylose/arabinose/galactoside ABC-type transport system permease subunit
VVGALQGGWLRQGDPVGGSDFTLLVVAAVIIGGVALTGGEGSVYGTLLGAWIIGMLYNGFILLGVQSYWNQFFIGLVIVLVASGELALKRRDDLGEFIRSSRRRLSRRLVPQAFAGRSARRQKGGPASS